MPASGVYSRIVYHHLYWVRVIFVHNEQQDQAFQDRCFNAWKESEALAESMLPMIGQLYRERSVVTSIYGQPIINRSVISILKAHRFVRQLENAELSVEQTFPFLQALIPLALAPSRIDIGKLAIKYERHAEGRSIQDFVNDEVQEALENSGDNQTSFSPQDVVLYGFGRIGRLLARILIEKSGGGHALRLRAIVVRKNSPNDLTKRASLLRRDSIHGSFAGTIGVDTQRNALIVNGNCIHVLYADSLDELDYTQYGINQAVLVDNTGRWRDQEGLEQHLKCSGVAKVLLTAPGKGEIKNIVFGINHQLMTQDDQIVSAASCTTNAIVPVLKVVNDRFGIKNGHVETVHSYTNDQNLIDNYHAGNRRGRSAPLNMVITETGAAKAVAKALPELKGKLTGNAIRVPTPNVSLAILNLNLQAETTKEALNEFLRRISLDSPYRKQIDYVNSPEVVSTDFIGSRRAAIVDAQSTIVDKERCVLYVWYDNEFGYSAQVVRMLQAMSGISYPTFPKELYA